MNLASILVTVVVAALLGLAIRYLAKHGMCAACEDRDACRNALKASRRGEHPASLCGGNCRGCPYYLEEQRMKAANLPTGKQARS
ncbi:MAG: hypothetical protein LKJ21_09545 [Oscillospiraceae bacterium]|jgi:hypothetical protein|nr:hypothetical protein [Oscillospiraceae bacterium]MCI1990754.1 hypothetical protein [Oscillospiraceae bacterium]MCI2035728.1 hypothetical protein [Oscillospiraceae bacterium]